MKNTAPTTDLQDVIRFTPAATSIDFIELLRKCYWTEKKLEELLPILAQQATSYELITAINEHLATTKRQIIRLIHVFDSMQERVKGSKCKTVSRYLAETATFEDRHPLGYARDNAIILKCQQIMSHEINTLTSLRIEAAMHNEEVLASYLSAAIEEEKAAHGVLTEIALQSIYFDQAV